MNTEIQRQIHDNMDMRDTEELLAIWKTNDRVEWSDEAFEVIASILRSRDVQLPEQSAPVTEHEEADENDVELTEEELRIVDDENPPDFFDPMEALELGKWLRIAALGSILIAILSGLTQLGAYRNLAQSFFGGVAGAAVAVAALVALMLLLSVAFEIIMTYIPLRVLAHILRILLQMEYNSRHPAARPE